jgi:hypothetical protein
MSELKKGLFRRPKLHDASSEGQASRLSAMEKRRLRRQLRRQMTLSVLPTLLTLGNGVCGMTAIAVATSANLVWENETKLLVAGLAIFGGMLFDALDWIVCVMRLRSEPRRPCLFGGLRMAKRLTANLSGPSVCCSRFAC